MATVGKMMAIGGDPEKVAVEYFASPDRVYGWDRLDGFRGLMGGVGVRGVFFESERDDYHDGPKLFRVSRDYMIWFAER